MTKSPAGELLSNQLLSENNAIEGFIRQIEAHWSNIGKDQVKLYARVLSLD